jgi:GH18 family chitinase
VAFYGRSLKNCNGLFQPHGGVDNITYWQDEGMPLYYNILANIGGYTPQWDSQAQVPYLTDAAGHRFVSYDNAQSVAIKAQFVADQQARGIIIWEITGDYIQNGATLSTPLADTLNAIFCNAALPRPDLSVANPSLIPSTVQVGNTVSLNTTLYNNGNATANPSEIAFYLSSNTYPRTRYRPATYQRERGKYSRYRRNFALFSHHRHTRLSIGRNLVCDCRS